MKYLNPEILQAGDVVITTDIYPFSNITRARTWQKTPRIHLGMDLGTHTFMVCDRGHKLYYACEMRPRLRMTELTRYDHGRFSPMPHIVKVLRHPLFSNGNDSFDRIEKMNEYMIKMHSFGVRYGWDEILKLAGLNVPENPYNLICSMWCCKPYAEIGIEMPWPKDHIVVPRDWQEWTGLDTIYPYK